MNHPGDEDWRWLIGTLMAGVQPMLCALVILVAGALGGQA